VLSEAAVPNATRSPIVPIAFVIIALGPVGACRTARPNGSTSMYAAAPALTASRGSSSLECAEIQSARVDNAYEAVMRFRPEFLRPRGAAAATDPSGAAPMVYVDGVKQGGPEMLRTIPVAAIGEIRYLSATAASDRFGPLYPGGVIAVRTRR
jgi:hypothetical protein